MSASPGVEPQLLVVPWLPITAWLLVAGGGRPGQGTAAGRYCRCSWAGLGWAGLGWGELGTTAPLPPPRQQRHTVNIEQASSRAAATLALLHCYSATNLQSYSATELQSYKATEGKRGGASGCWVQGDTAEDTGLVMCSSEVWT